MNHPIIVLHWDNKMKLVPGSPFSLFKFFMKKKSSSAYKVAIIVITVIIFVNSELHSTSKVWQIQKTFLKEFLYMLFRFVL